MASKKNKRILFIVPYPLGMAPSQRFRFEQYFEVLNQVEFLVDVRSFLDRKTMLFLYQKGNFTRKVWSVFFGMLGRVIDVFTVFRYEYVFIHREAAPIGPPIFEWLIIKIFRKKVIFDFDDAIWLENTSDTNTFIRLFKRYRNADNICRWATKVSCGNQYIMEHARQFNPNVVHNPTTIDTVGLHSSVKKYVDKKMVIGWTGTHSTMKYLLDLMPMFEKLEREFDFELLVIADQKPTVALQCFRYLSWNKATEMTDLLKIDVGIMPLADDKWSQGKCGFKALQYMALGIPAIVSPVGVNTQIVDHGVNGWICDSVEDWELRLREILKGKIQLQSLSYAARKKVETHYSVVSNTDNFLRLFSD